MVSITPQNALKLSAWLAVHEPRLFRQILVTTGKLQRSPLGRLGFFGDDATLSEVTVDVPDTSVTTSPPDLPLADISVDPSLVSLSASQSDAITAAISAPPPVDAATADASQSSGGFWSALGSGVSSIAGAVGKVASSLTSPQAMQAVGNTATAFFNAQARTAQTQMQQAAVNAQLARVNSGLSPAPIRYVTNPITGQVTPVYQTNTGAVPLTQPILSQLTQSTGLSPVVLIGGAIAFVILASLLAARR